MKSLLTAVLVGALLLVLFANTHVASGAFGLEDPQLCISGQLLNVVPSSPADVTISVPPGTNVDYNAANCGGKKRNSIPASNVTFDASNKMVVTAYTGSSGDITFSFNGASVTKSNSSGSVSVNFKLP
jgi:hypothetical protein